MKIIVAICTWNRAALLTQTLENMLNLKSDASFSWELLIVNNNCTDDTDKVIAEFSGLLPIRRIFEPTPGLSNARNAAVRNATGDYIVWTDDDVLVDSDWLLAYARAFREWPDAAVFGGPITPWFEGEPPPWLKESWHVVSAAFAVRDLGDEPIPLSVEEGIVPFGANFAVRMAEQRRHLYDPNLGLNAGKVVLGEESQVIAAIMAEGFSGRWVPDAKVKHWLPKGRQTLEYLKKYYYGAGRTRKLQVTAIGDEIGQIWLARRYLGLCLRYLCSRLFDPPIVWVELLSRRSFAKGRIFG
ncbi:glycosyltransferase [Geoalkalibacter sp.]|uniref:glycosyltransferase n=1 Tax=Geoalkalibacter sp. TaxID=3041440 RepID=UPI00272DF8D9|nr:glycosyltransferase [Geoalkalibacter sp.]